MRNLTEYERSRIKDAIRLSKKFSDKVMRQKIKALLKEPLTTDTASIISVFFKTHARSTNEQCIRFF